MTVPDPSVRRAERRFRLALEATASLAYEWHLASGAIAWYGDVDAALGLPPGALPRTLAGWESMLHPDDREHVIVALDAAQANREPFHLLYRVVRADGGVRWWREHGLFSAGDEAGDDCYIGACSDVTTQHVREEQLRQAQKLEAIATLAGGMAHDVNNLLSVVQGYAELLREQLADRPDGQELLDEVLTAVQRTGTRTKHLLAFSRRQLLRPHALPLARAVAELQDALHTVVGASVRLEFALADDTPWVRLDVQQLEQVLVHLATNAKEAMPAGGSLTIACGCDARGDAWLTVRDTGCGMSAEVQARIFEPFYTTKPGGRGTGLGLSAAMGVVQQHGGTIGVESAPGAGTTFRITLPASGSSEAVTADPEPAAPPEPTRGQRILVVDDDAVFGLLMRRLLTDLDYRVTLAGSVGEALGLLASAPDPVSLVITDVIMPGGSGHDLAARLRESHPELPVLFMSGYDTAQLPSGDAAGASRITVLQKPFTQEQLDRAVHDAMGGLAVR